MRRIAFKALDEEILTFDLPRRASRNRILRAVRHLHEGHEEAGVVLFGLSQSETECVAEIVAELEAHRPGAK